MDSLIIIQVWSVSLPLCVTLPAEFQLSGEKFQLSGEKLQLSRLKLKIEQKIPEKICVCVNLESGLLKGVQNVSSCEKIYLVCNSCRIVVEVVESRIEC